MRQRELLGTAIPCTYISEPHAFIVRVLTVIPRDA